jgi:hypothetical protein
MEPLRTPLGGGGVVLHFTKNHYFHIKMGYGRGTNNYAKILSMKLLLLYAMEKYILIFKYLVI